MNLHSASSAFRARPVPVIAALLAISAIGSAVLVGCGGGAKNTDNSQTPSATSTPSATPAPSSSAPAAGGDEGAQIYAQRCALCHGATGHGDGPAAASLNPKPRNHTDGAYMNSRTDDQLLEVIRNGKPPMPAWKGVLTEDQMHAVLKHVRSLAVPPYPGPK